MKKAFLLLAMVWVFSCEREPLPQTDCWVCTYHYLGQPNTITRDNICGKSQEWIDTYIDMVYFHYGYILESLYCIRQK
jgi:hypothetical protein